MKKLTKLEKKIFEDFEKLMSKIRFIYKLNMSTVKSIYIIIIIFSFLLEVRIYFYFYILLLFL